MTTLTPRRAASNTAAAPAACRSRQRPAPPSEAEQRARSYRAVQASEMNRDGLTILKAVRDLLKLLEQFQRDHDEADLAKAILAAGVAGPIARGWGELGAQMLHDTAGALWSLRAYGSVLSTSLVPARDDADRTPPDAGR